MVADAQLALTAEETPPEPERFFVDLMQEFARERLGWPDALLVTRTSLREKSFDGFELEVWEREPPKVSKGPNAGKRNWRSRGIRRQIIIVGGPEFREFQAAWAKSTGRCLECQGNGTEWRSWRVGVGHTFATCSKCGGTGKRADELAKAGA